MIDATRLPDGSIAVANGGSGEVRLFSATGEFEWSFGGEGEGPGEFQNLSVVAELEQGIVAFDARPGRITLVDRNGTLTDVISLPDPGRFWLGLHALNDTTALGVVHGDGEGWWSDGIVRRPVWSFEYRSPREPLWTP